MIMYTLELAAMKDLSICYDMIEEGRKFQREQGFEQWTESYPNCDTIREDIESRKGYVIKSDGDIAGYLCIDFSGEPAYDDIKGAWRRDTPYAVVHRMAFRQKTRGKGMAGIAFDLIEDLCSKHDVKNIRVDTDFPNKRMQHILEKKGFVNCGVIVFQGGEKLAYDKLL